MRELLVAETRDEALDRYAEGLLAQYRYYFQNGAFIPEYEPWMKTVRDARELTWELVSNERVIWGSPEAIVGSRFGAGARRSTRITCR